MKNQKQIVYNIVKQAGSRGLRTEQVKIEAMRQGVSCADRHLRWLQADGIIESERKKGDKTHTWKMLPPKNYFRQGATIYPCNNERIDTGKPLTLSFMHKYPYKEA